MTTFSRFTCLIALRFWPLFSKIVQFFVRNKSKNIYYGSFFIKNIYSITRNNEQNNVKMVLLAVDWSSRSNQKWPKSGKNWPKSGIAIIKKCAYS